MARARGRPRNEEPSETLHLRLEPELSQKLAQFMILTEEKHYTRSAVMKMALKKFLDYELNIVEEAKGTYY